MLPVLIKNINTIVLDIAFTAEEALLFYRMPNT